MSASSTSNGAARPQRDARARSRRATSASRWDGKDASGNVVANGPLQHRRRPPAAAARAVAAADRHLDRDRRHPVARQRRRDQARHRPRAARRPTPPSASPDPANTEPVPCPSTPRFPASSGAQTDLGTISNNIANVGSYRLQEEPRRVRRHHVAASTHDRRPGHAPEEHRAAIHARAASRPRRATSISRSRAPASSSPATR